MPIYGWGAWPVSFVYYCLPEEYASVIPSSHSIVQTGTWLDFFLFSQTVYLSGLKTGLWGCGLTGAIEVR